MAKAQRRMEPGTVSTLATAAAVGRDRWSPVLAAVRDQAAALPPAGRLVVCADLMARTLRAPEWDFGAARSLAIAMAHRPGFGEHVRNAIPDIVGNTPAAIDREAFSSVRPVDGLDAIASLAWERIRSTDAAARADGCDAATLRIQLLHTLCGAARNRAPEAAGLALAMIDDAPNTSRLIVPACSTENGGVVRWLSGPDGPVASPARFDDAAIIRAAAIAAQSFNPLPPLAFRKVRGMLVRIAPTAAPAFAIAALIPLLDSYGPEYLRPFVDEPLADDLDDDPVRIVPDRSSAGAHHNAAAAAIRSIGSGAFAKTAAQMQDTLIGCAEAILTENQVRCVPVLFSSLLVWMLRSFHAEHRQDIARDMRDSWGNVLALMARHRAPRALSGLRPW